MHGDKSLKETAAHWRPAEFTGMVSISCVSEVIQKRIASLTGKYPVQYLQILDHLQVRTRF